MDFIMQMLVNKGYKNIKRISVNPGEINTKCYKRVINNHIVARHDINSLNDKRG